MSLPDPTSAGATFAVLVDKGLTCPQCEGTLHHAVSCYDRTLVEAEGAEAPTQFSARCVLCQFVSDEVFFDYNGNGPIEQE